MFAASLHRGLSFIAHKKAPLNGAFSKEEKLKIKANALIYKVIHAPATCTALYGTCCTPCRCVIYAFFFYKLIF
jgi:hypothetical protein